MAYTMQDLESNPISILQSLVDQYHADPDSFTEDQAERIAILAFDAGINFEPETKKAKKFAFDVADTALFGLLPNEWRPKRVGEDLYGESVGEQISGALGTISGLIPAGLGASAVIKGGMKRAKGLFKGKKGGAGGSNSGQNVTEIPQLNLPQGNPPLQLSSGQGVHRGDLSLMNILNQTSQPIRAPKLLGPSTLLDNPRDYLNTAINQAFI